MNRAAVLFKGPNTCVIGILKREKRREQKNIWISHGWSFFKFDENYKPTVSKSSTISKQKKPEGKNF